MGKVVEFKSISVLLSHERTDFNKLKVTMHLIPDIVLDKVGEECCALSIDDNGRLILRSSDPEVFDKFSIDGKYKIEISEVLED